MGVAEDLRGFLPFAGPPKLSLEREGGNDMTKIVIRKPEAVQLTAAAYGDGACAMV